MENGEMKEKRSGGSFVGFLYNIVIPKFINGLVKSTAFCRAAVIVKSVIAKSALCNIERFWKPISITTF